MPDTSTSLQLTNQTGKAILLTMETAGIETAATDIIPAASAGLAILPTASGNPVIPAGGSSAVTLNSRYSAGSDLSGPLRRYDLQVNDPEWCYPLSRLAVTPDLSGGTPLFSPVTVPPADAEIMEQAVRFSQAISLYPDSKLVQDYTNALQTLKEAIAAGADGSEGAADRVAGTIETGLSGFFEGTQAYRKVTLPALASIEAYYRDFPYAWADFKDRMDYYLYGSDGSQSSFQGILSLQKTGAADPAKPNGGYSCVFTPVLNPGGSDNPSLNPAGNKSLTYSKGFFMDDPASQTPGIVLKGAFMLQNFFIDKGEENTPMLVMTGNIGGLLCIGFPRKKRAAMAALSASKEQLNPVEEWWTAITHPKTQHDLILSILTLVGAVALVGAVGFAIYRIYKLVKLPGLPKEELLFKTVEYLGADGKYEIHDLHENAAKWAGAKEQVPIDDMVSYVYRFAGTSKVQRVASGLVEALDLQHDAIIEIKRVYKSADLEDIISSIRTSKLRLKEASGPTLEKVVEAETAQFQHISRRVLSITYNLDEKIDSTLRENILKSHSQSERIYEEVNDVFKGLTEERLVEDPLPREVFAPEL